MAVEPYPGAPRGLGGRRAHPTIEPRDVPTARVGEFGGLVTPPRRGRTHDGERGGLGAWAVPERRGRSDGFASGGPSE